MSKITDGFRVNALRRGVVVVPKNRDKTLNPALAHAATIEMANLGFILNPAEVTGVSVKTLENMLQDARTLIGSDRNMIPVYPGFPQQVEELDTLTLLTEQILHYWTAGAYLPNHPAAAREGLPIADMLRNARSVKVMSAAEAAKNILTQLSNESRALSQSDLELMFEAAYLHSLTLDEVTELCKTAKNGENMQWLLYCAANTTEHSLAELLSAAIPGCYNLDQVLRTVLELYSVPAAEKYKKNYTRAVRNLSNSNARAVKMKNISRPSRRVIITRVGELSAGYRADALITRVTLWRRVMRAVHPYDYALNDAEKRAVDIIHGNIPYRTLNSLIEEAMEQEDVYAVASLLAENRPGDLLRRIVAVLRFTKNVAQAKFLAEKMKESCVTAQLTTLISSYNGVLSANDEHARVTRVAGLNNSMVEREAAKVDENYLNIVKDAILDAMRGKLATLPAPKPGVGTCSTMPVPLVRRDAASTDRLLERGEILTPVGKGTTLRVFGHWNNNMKKYGYMDIGVAVLDENFNLLAVNTWNTWNENRDWSVYSGDTCVRPGDNAAEFIDVKLNKLKTRFPEAAWLAMTVQSWSGFPMEDVDFIAGLMYRSDANKGEVFDARTVETAFKPTVNSTNALPYAYNIKRKEMVWIDSSNGSTNSGISASYDPTIGDVVYDGVGRPRLTLGELAALWAEAHKVAVAPDAPVDREALISLL